MSTPQEVLQIQFGSLSLTKGKNFKIVSQKGEDDSFSCASYHTLLKTGAAVPSILVALVKEDLKKQNVLLSELNIHALHVRSYHSWTEMSQSGFGPGDLEPQSVGTLDTNNLENFKMEAISETTTSKTYKFENPAWGTLTLFTDKPTISWASNNLPMTTRMLGWLADYNYVFTPQ